MGSDSKFLTIAAVIIVALILQVLLMTTTGHQDTPGKAAVEFSKAYFKLSENMKDRFCNEIAENDGSVVVIPANMQGFDLILDSGQLRRGQN